MSNFEFCAPGQLILESIFAPNNDDDDDDESCGTINILAWKDSFDGMLKYAKIGITSPYIIEEAEEMARQKVEESQRISSSV